VLLTLLAGLASGACGGGDPAPQNYNGKPAGHPEERQMASCGSWYLLPKVDFDQERRDRGGDVTAFISPTAPRLPSADSNRDGVVTLRGLHGFINDCAGCREASTRSRRRWGVTATRDLFAFIDH